MAYVEEKNTGDKYRKDYLFSLEKMIEHLQSEADKARSDYFNKMKNSQEEYRKQLFMMLGKPLCDYQQTEIPRADVELCFHDERIKISRMQLTMSIGIKFYGMFFEHSGNEIRPLVIAEHGMLGTPELCSGLFATGSSNYNDMVMRVFDKGVNVFVPQPLLWNDKIYEPNFGGASIEAKRESIDAKLKQLGSSITAVEIYAIMKSIDYLSTLKNVNKEKIGMMGLSYGGFYTLFTAACDTRIKAAFSCCQYNNRFVYPRVDWTWFNSGYTFLDNEVASLVYPRHLFLTVGKNDPTFDYKEAEKEYLKLIHMYDDSSWVDFCSFDGEHEFIKDDQLLNKFVALVNSDDFC